MRLWVDGDPHAPVRGGRDRLRAAADRRSSRPPGSVAGSMRADGAVAAVGHPDRAGADRDRRAASCPTGIVVVTARVLGSIRVTASSPRVGQPTRRPLPTRDRARARVRPRSAFVSPVGSTRVTLSASSSVTHTAPSPIAIAGRPRVRIDPVMGNLGRGRVKAGEQASTTEQPRRRFRAPRSHPVRPERHCRSVPRARPSRTPDRGDSRTPRSLAAFDSTTQIALALAAMPVGTPLTGMYPQSSAASPGRPARRSDRRGWRPTAIPTPNTIRAGPSPGRCRR